jgi:molybdopterin-guanine dinucleotide biosynthesis protein A
MTEPSDRSAVAGIVLAGGQASRFGRDKLAEPVDGRPLLHHALEALGSMASEILVVISPAGAIPSLPGGRDQPPVRLVRDPELYGGPLVALAAALEVVSAPVALLVGGDMPALQPTVLAAMVDALRERDADVVLLDGPGPVQSMPAAMRTAAAQSAARDVLGEGGRALRALYDRLRLVAIPLAEWTRLDPGQRTLRDVDTPDDLPG